MESIYSLGKREEVMHTLASSAESCCQLDWKFAAHQRTKEET